MVDVAEQAYTEAATPMGWDMNTIRFPGISSCMAVCVRPTKPSGGLVGLHLGLFMGPTHGGDMITTLQVNRYLSDFFKLCGSKAYGASDVMLMGMWDYWAYNADARLALRNSVASYAKAQGLANYNYYNSSGFDRINFEITRGAATYGTGLNTFTGTAVPFVATPT